MHYDRKTFFDAVRSSLFGGNLTQSQVDGMEAVLSAAPPDFFIKNLAYALATDFHETARTMQPIEEYGRGAGKSYGIPDPKTKQAYYGRGYVQLTWKSNYQKAKDRLGPDFVNDATLALNPTHAANIMFRGMSEGWFTGKKLSDYFTATTSDPVNARRIINGTDKASTIAGYYTKFLDALLKAERPDEPAHPAVCPTCGQPWPHAA